MQIYLACTVRGDRGAVTALRSLVESLERNGHTILTKHLLEDNVRQSTRPFSTSACRDNAHTS
jgi:hypothetical protein